MTHPFAAWAKTLKDADYYCYLAADKDVELQCKVINYMPINQYYSLLLKKERAYYDEKKAMEKASNSVQHKGGKQRRNVR